MKYVYILIGVIVLVRIDMLLLGVETLMNKFRTKSQDTSVSSTPVEPPETEIVSLKEDKSFNQNPRGKFFALLDDFHASPIKPVREQAMEILRKNPTILGPKLDPVFEGELIKYTDLVYNKNEELSNFLLDLLGQLQGENLEVVRRLLSIMLDNNLEGFLKAYSRSKDTNCMIAGLLGHTVPEEEKLNEYIEREELLNEFVGREKIEPMLLNLAKNCLLVVKMQIQKLTPAQEDPAETPAVAPEAAPTPTPTPSTNP